MTITTIAHGPVPAFAKWAFTTRRVEKNDVRGASQDFANAVPGDLVLAEVLSLGSHQKTQLAAGRASQLHIGDHIVLCCGDRYAPDQFEGSGILDPEGSDMLAGGGIIGKMNHAHAKMAKPTQLKPVAMLTDIHDEVINIASYGLPSQPAPQDMIVIGVVGASMNAGKTTATAAFAHGLVKAGLNVAGIKATGTGAFGDLNALQDAGLPYVADFTDAGMPSTYLQPLDMVERGLTALLADARKSGAEVAIIEFADGIYQQETAGLLEQSSLVRSLFSGFLFASGDAVSVVGGVRHMRAIGWDPVAISGMVSLSPLAVQEATAITNASILKREELMNPETALELVTPFIEAASEAAIAA